MSKIINFPQNFRLKKFYITQKEADDMFTQISKSSRTLGRLEGFAVGFMLSGPIYLLISVFILPYLGK